MGARMFSNYIADINQINTTIINEIGKWAVISDQTISGGAVAEVNFTSLDLDTSGIYALYVYWINGTISSTDIRLNFNGDTTAGNYDVQQLYCNGAAANPAHYDAPYLIVGDANSTMDGYFIIQKVSGQIPRISGMSGRKDVANLGTFLTNLTWVTTNNVTSMRLYSEGATAISNGSRFVLMKYVA